MKKEKPDKYCMVYRLSRDGKIYYQEYIKDFFTPAGNMEALYRIKIYFKK